MRASQLLEQRTNPSKRELLALAMEFIDEGFLSTPLPSWLRQDGGYDWNAAKNAHLAQLPMSRLKQLCADTDKTLSKIHYKIWLEHENDRLAEVIRNLEASRAKIACELSSLNVYS